MAGKQRSAATPFITENAEESGLPSPRLPELAASSGTLDRLVDQARDYARQAKADTTNRAYAADWSHFSRWCRMKGLDPLPSSPEDPVSPELIGLYITDCASLNSPSGQSETLSVATIERRLSGLAWVYQQKGYRLDRSDRHIAGVLAGIRRKHGRPPRKKEAIFADDILAMVGTLDHSLRGLRDRAILLLGFAGGLRRSEIVGLDLNPDDTDDGSGWIELVEQGALLTFRSKTGWRDAVIGRGSSEASCPVKALETWIHFAKLAHGPVFRSILRDNRAISGNRLSDKHVARLVKKTVLASGIRQELPETERLRLFSGHSLRSGLASSAEIDERHIQKQLGHASPQMTRRYQQIRDRFKINLTKAAGL
ncbi:tyrosine-type recombinase/integrase [Coralliovum pocilloporae]|uniref:tyrosine-type recombinase/integrase n=1 Tax=Coralliovum pocilloporae TaxID=3066369 RepID=UPI003306F04E